MKDGQIVRQGTMDEIATVDPELLHRWQEMIEDIESESESESEEESKTYKERQKLRRSVSDMEVEEEGKARLTKSGRIVPPAGRFVLFFWSASYTGRTTQIFVVRNLSRCMSLFSVGV